MSDNILPSQKIFSIKDARELSRKRLPKLVFDFIDGASGDEKLAEINSIALDQIRLEPKVLRNVEKRSLKKKVLGYEFNFPFGFAPMGMTNLSWPGADSMLAAESARNNIYKEEKKSAFAKLSEIIITMASRPSGLIGLSILVFHIILAFTSPYIAPHDFKAIDPTLMLQAPSAEYWFGTDDLGRDVFTRTILGGRTALTITFFGSLIALLWGGLLGIFCGLVGGKIDDVVMRIVDAFLSIPWILAMLLIVSLLGTSTEVLIPALGFFYGKGIVRVARAATHDVIAKDFIVSARARGHSNFSIIWNEIIPNVRDAILVEGAMRWSWMLLGFSSLSFLGFGVSPPTPDWGLMISNARGLMSFAYWAVIAPIVGLSSLIIGINLTADAFAKALGIDRSTKAPV